MRITEVHAVYPRYRHVAPSWRTHFWQIVVRIDTDAGICGWGYGGGGEGAERVVNGHFRELLLGREVGADGEQIARIWDELYRASVPYGRRGIAIMALSGVDLALWDLAGRLAGKPVWELLGGGSGRDRVRAYATGGEVSRFRDSGFTATKTSIRLRATPAAGDDADVAAREAVSAAVAWASEGRRMLGPEALLMVDAYMSWTPALAVSMAKALQESGVYWLEDVLPPDEIEDLAALRPRIKPSLLAGGEHEFTHYGFAEVARAGALDLWQPDVTWCGGLTAARRIVDLAHHHGIAVVLHRGGEVWGLQLLASGACDDLAELVLGSRGARRDRLWLGEPQVVDGYLTVSNGPGFGVEINTEYL